MDAARARVGSILEWLLAVACIVAVLAIGSIVVRGVRAGSAVPPVSANEAPIPDPPAAVPARAVFVPLLLLPNGVEVRVGESAAQVASRLGPEVEVALPSIDRTPLGERMTRFYEQGSTRFAIVLESSAGDGQVRVAAIYLQ